MHSDTEVNADQETLDTSTTRQHLYEWERPFDSGERLPSSPKPQSSELRRADVDALVTAAADHYGLTKEEIRRDAHIARVLYVLRTTLGENLVVARSYKRVDEPAGQFVFRGGTALVSAWDVCERYSHDLDLMFGGWWHLNNRRMRQALRQMPKRVAFACGTEPARERPIIRSHISFFELPAEGLEKPLSLDVLAIPHHPPPIRIEHRKVMSLAGRLAGPDMLERCPFLGGFTVPALGPGSTAMDNLLAQVDVARERTTKEIARRARDWYDLGRIALCADPIGANLERDGAALLGVSEWWVQLVGDPVRRPADGFASIPTVRKGTPEHDALVDAYDLMQDKMVWGARLPLGDAIELALTLDPGPAETYNPQ